MQQTEETVRTEMYQGKVEQEQRMHGFDSKAIVVAYLGEWGDACRMCILEDPAK